MTPQLARLLNPSLILNIQQQLLHHRRHVTLALSNIVISGHASSSLSSSTTLQTCTAPKPRIDCERNQWHRRYHTYEKRRMENPKITAVYNRSNSTSNGHDKNDEIAASKSNRNSEKEENNEKSDNGQKEAIYLHVAPCGDYWTGASIFAAKHLQPDYVRSVELPPGLEDDDILEEILERGGKDMLQGIYDSKCLPPDFGVSDGEIEEEEGR
mmetsp:Transcript_24731/g.36263  ORF Transcript_24731/g.36263 Transcript_24731/m.36263 type:complete len:212 (+) Transcript_24731:32-667(+)